MGRRDILKALLRSGDEMAETPRTLAWVNRAADGTPSETWKFTRGAGDVYRGVVDGQPFGDGFEGGKEGVKEYIRGRKAGDW
jgi:hypothetical protein